jgi:MSHA pilin protein MshD
MCTKSQSGTSLIELIFFILVVGIALVGIQTAFTFTAKGGADPLIAKQALALAQAALEEIQLQPVAVVAGTCTGTTRNACNNVDDYHNISSWTGDKRLNGTSMDATMGLANYQITVTVENGANDNGVVVAGDIRRITVTVTNGAHTTSLQGYAL